MVRDLIYVGYDVTNMNFNLINKNPTGKGFYRYKLELDDNVQLQEAEETKEQFLVFSAKNSVTGFMADEHGEETTDEVFRLTAEFEMKFRIHRTTPAKPDEIKECSWYFENIAHMEGKRIIDSLASHTLMRGASVPGDKREYAKSEASE